MNSNTHTFFCSEMDCSNETLRPDVRCMDCWESTLTREQPDYEGCVGCGYYGPALGSNNGYCPACWQQRFGYESPIAVADETKPHWCGHVDCQPCQSEYHEQCGGCGKNCDLWDHRYCKECYEKPVVVRLSDELKAELFANLPTEGDKWSFTPAHPPLPPSPEPRHTSLQSMRDEIAEIEERLKTNMTKGQKDDWVWLLLNRRADLAEAEKEMWAGFDADDLRKLDLLARY
jgi:hypothetical protein